MPSPSPSPKLRDTERVLLMPGMNRFKKNWMVAGAFGREHVVLEPNKPTVVSRMMGDAMWAKKQLYDKSVTVPDGTNVAGRMASGVDAGLETEERFDKYPIVFLDRM